VDRDAAGTGSVAARCALGAPDGAHDLVLAAALRDQALDQQPEVEVVVRPHPERRRGVVCGREAQAGRGGAAEIRRLPRGGAV
jgi:hypothetical protein